ncbi:MAG: biliverdin-producing heme oxygenase [Planctomycetota bacterium]
MRNELRLGTRESHQRLDLFVGSLSPFGSDRAYRVYLTAMNSLYRVYGDSLGWASKQAGLPCPVAGLLNAIESDFGGPVPDSGAMPEGSATTEQRWAAAYVLEGSAMGARYLSRELNETSLPSAFLTKLAADSHDRWPKFVAALDEADCDVQTTVAAAVGVFDFVRKRFVELADGAGISPAQ